ncbi:preprotein translocase subunit YajC [Clostridium putrefaciens]|uniref:Preprotein translocase subunit YajC n=1 Tax=Clostridium putrefaciens TaxID=99675 RepID=A0A381J5K0_9CLOT|nr:preprotein translocase subunit YajC [Clostridium putrefaciens]SUY46306.1 preprotein translocase subunit YajC [Clostridium putrefaciens]
MKNITLWIVIVIMIVYAIIFIIIQGKNKKVSKNQQKTIEDFHSKLKKGDHIITLSGIYGYIYAIDANKVSVEISKGIYVDMDIQSIMGVLNKSH